MDHLGVLDLRHGSKITSKSQPLCSFSPSVGPLDLSISNKSYDEGKSTVPSPEYIRPSVITPNIQLTTNTVREKSWWSHRSHLSIDSDSSFESEHEIEYSLPGPWIFSRSDDDIGGNITATRCSSVESVSRRESMSSNDQPDLAHTDTENETDMSEQNVSKSSGFCKELPSLTANVSIGQERRNSMILKLSSCQAEIIDPADVHSELISNRRRTSTIENDDDSDGNSSLKICETETYIEELLRMQPETRNEPRKISKNISVGIQERATKYIKEIRKTKSDMGLNLEMDGKKKQYCIKCNDEFYSVAALLQHLMTHSSRNPGERLIKCPVCCKRFSTLSTLEQHILKLHTGEMKFVCEVCEAPYKFYTHLKKHLITSRCGKKTTKVL